jgi:hypothetical protein
VIILRYEVSVKFNKDFITVDEEMKKITIGIRSKPVKGKANEELIKKLAEHLDIPSSNIYIIAGVHSRNKIVEISKE